MAAEIGDSQTPEFSQEPKPQILSNAAKSSPSQIPFVQNAPYFSAPGLVLKFWWQEEAITQLCVKNTTKAKQRRPPRGAPGISTFMHFGISTFSSCHFSNGMQGLNLTILYNKAKIRLAQSRLHECISLSHSLPSVE